MHDNKFVCVCMFKRMYTRWKIIMIIMDTKKKRAREKYNETNVKKKTFKIKW